MHFDRTKRKKSIRIIKFVKKIKTNGHENVIENYEMFQVLHSHIKIVEHTELVAKT